ncbi:MAG: amino acid adenylation domain-containing protein [Acidobacteriota bacterium]
MASSITLLTDGAHDEHIGFWTSVLGTITDDFHIRQPWLSSPIASGETVAEECRIEPATAALLEELGRGQDAGVLVTIVAAVSLLLHTHTHSAVVTIDSPALAGDEADEPGEDLIPLVTAVDRRWSVRDYLKRVSETVANSYSYQSFPVAQFAKVMLKRPRPRTNVLVTFIGLHKVPSGAPTGAGDYDLHITLSRTPALGIRLTGRTPAFSREYLQTFAHQLGRVLAAFGDRAVKLEDIDLMGAEERHRVLARCHTGAAAAALPRTIHDLFQEQAGRTGSHVAIQLHDRTVDFDTLNRHANQLARFMQQDHGIQRGDVIGVVTERSPLAITALLAVLKAGAVYLPIDGDYPEQRLQFMVADAGVKMLLVHAAHVDRLTALYETPMFALDIQLETLDTAGTDLEPSCTPDDLAYIIYTSGSTGQPKAVLLEHRGFVTMVRHHIDAFGVTPADRLLQFYGHSFDSSLFEIFVSLLAGATLVMVDRDTINDPEQLSAYIEAQRITTLTMPPVYLGTLDRERLSAVRRYISAGDHSRVQDALLLAQTGDYYNSYGPTETSVCVTHYKVDPKRRYGMRIPIGKPITGTSIYLLDEDLEPVADGVVGQICVAGASVARGYLHRDDLTAEKFVSSRFVAGERMYLTGDLGVWLPDGNLEVIGRKDSQVKIRGYRVELGEIESVLDQHPLVTQSAVIAREDDLGHKRLAAYVTAAGAIEVAVLRDLLRSRLPDFMMPATFTVLDRMPVTANGKIDRTALLAIVAPTSPTDAAAGPDNPVQEALVRIWQDVLGVARVGIHDNLFDLGGDSILIIQIVSRAREAGLKLTPNQLFDHQTIAALSAVAVSVPQAAPLVIEREALEGPTPLTPMQAWFFEQRFADPHHFNQAVWLELPAGLDAAAAAAATQVLLAHHDALRLRFVDRGGRWTAEYAPLPTAAPFQTIDLTADRVGRQATLQEERLRDAVAACQTSFDLSTGPLVRVALLQFGGDRRSRLLFVAHHLVVDGVSWRILLDDFASAYAQIVRGETVALAAKTTSLRTWATRLMERAASLDSRYWLTAAAAAVPVPTDRPRLAGVNAVASAHEVTRTLDAETTTALLQDVPRTYATEISAVLLAGLALTFQAWTGSDRLLIDLEAHGREELLDGLDTSRTVGWFTAQFPIQLQVGWQASPGDAIKSVKEQLRAVPQRGAGFGVLRYLSADARLVEALKQRPAPEVLFNYFGQAGRVLAVGLDWTLVPGTISGAISARATRPHLLEINAIVADGRLTVTWTFSAAIHDPSTIGELASRYEAALRLLVDHCRTTRTTQFTPSDFPAAGLDQKSLDALQTKINR